MPDNFMTRRVLVAGLALGLLATAPATSSASAAPTGRADEPPNGPSPSEVALRHLKANAEGAVRVHRDHRGRVDFLRSADGEVIVDPPATGPRQSARELLDRYGAAFGLAGPRSDAAVVQSSPSQTGGALVRAQQEIDGLPVFGGQIVLSLDQDQALTSVAADTTPVTPVAPPNVAPTTAARTAVTVTAKAHAVAPSTLTVSPATRWIYDPTLVHTFDPLGRRPVWRLEVSNGSNIRELVLVDTTRGGVALHYNQAAGLNRIVCDNANAVRAGEPSCTAAVRTEGTGPTGQAEVDAAFDNAGATSAFYQQVAGLDLTELIGTGTTGARRLVSTVRWCSYGEACPMANAFWDGSQMVYGDGFAAADDVVAHELTHGVVDRTSQLFYFHQSGALNESLADVIGEIVDHRNTTTGDDDSAWTLGEDAPGGALRSLKDPTLFGQPDAMTSPDYATASANDDAGEVHTNDGVGNKAAYLISQGGTLNGVTVTGIDDHDPTLTKTATLYTEVIQRLTSGSEYADLARVLTTTCDELAAAGRAGFTSPDCTSVRAAVEATQMAQPPTDPAAAAAEAPATCPTGTFKQILYRDDDGVTDNTWNIGDLWFQAPDTYWGAPGYAQSGRDSWFGFDPDPGGYGDPYSSSLWSTTDVALPAGQPSYLHFHHAHIFEWYDANDTQPARYPDGGSLSVLTEHRTADGTSYWADPLTPLDWVNGPTQQITNADQSWTGFGGDSHGYGSSRVDLTPLAGQAVRPRWTVVGDASGSFLGWWIDNVEIYTCPSAMPSTPRGVIASGRIGSATVSWKPPAYTGSGISRYRITRSGAGTRTVSATTSQATFTGLPAKPVRFTVAAVNATGDTGPGTSVTLQPTSLRITPASTRVQEGLRFRIDTRLFRAGTTRPVARQQVALQRRAVGSHRWRLTYPGLATTRSDGTAHWKVTQWRAYDYRVVFAGNKGWLGSRSRVVRIGLRRR